MNKRILGGLTVGLLAVVLLQGATGVGQGGQPEAKVESAFRVNCEGMPAYTVGVDVGVFISCSRDRTQWSIRWTGDSARSSRLAERDYLFTGEIRARHVFDVVEYSFDDEPFYPDSWYLRTASNHDVLGFNAAVSTGDDGLDFAIESARTLVFDLDGNLIEGPGSYSLTASDIYIGADGLHPADISFVIRTH
jgi:hypothetical protein